MAALAKVVGMSARAMGLGSVGAVFEREEQLMLAALVFSSSSESNAKTRAMDHCMLQTKSDYGGLIAGMGMRNLNSKRDLERFQRTCFLLCLLKLPSD